MQCLASSGLRSSQISSRRSSGSAAVTARRAPVVVAPRSRTGLVVSASAGLAPREEHSDLNSNSDGLGAFSPSLSVPNVTMAGGGNFGSGGSLGATMERSRMNFVMPTPVVKGPKLDDGGDGGDIGKINRNGGGGDGGGGDDDDYFNDGEDGDGDGDGEGQGQGGFFRLAIPESYDKFSIGAVFAEWMRTVQDLPAILRQAVTMGLFSSAQLVRFFSMDVRPNVTRVISRRLPPSLAREFVGRLMADPGFVQKVVLEASFAAFASLWYEYRLRGDKLKEEWDLATMNTLGMAAATAATVWLLAPSRSYGSIQKFPWQQMLDGLPNCVFDASGPLRQYSKQARAVGFLAKMAELSAVGALTGTLTSVLSSAAVAVRQKSNPEWQPSTEVPALGRSSAGLAAFFAINANTRYQLIGGLDRFLFDRTSFLWTYVALSGAARLVSNQVGELSRPWWQGLPAPTTLAHTGPSLPMPRKVKKKVKKAVPRSRVQQQQAAAAGATMASAAAVAVAADQPAEAQAVLEPAQGEGFAAPEAAATLMEAVTPLEGEQAGQQPYYLQQGVSAGEELQGAYQWQAAEQQQPEYAVEAEGEQAAFAQPVYDGADQQLQGSYYQYGNQYAGYSQPEAAGPQYAYRQ